MASSPRPPWRLAAENPARRFYTTPAWRAIRAEQLAREPRCQWRDAAEERCSRDATDVDHILPRRDGGTEDPANLQSLCHPHHSFKTAMEVQGRAVQDVPRCSRCHERYPTPAHLCPEERRAAREARRQPRLCAVCGGPMRYYGPASTASRHRACGRNPERWSCSGCGRPRHGKPGDLCRGCAPVGRPPTHGRNVRVTIPCLWCGDPLTVPGPVSSSVSRHRFHPECYPLADSARMELRRRLDGRSTAAFLAWLQERRAA